MKKLSLILLIFCLCAGIVYAEDGDDWSKVYENDADIQKPVPTITDKEFKNAYDFKMGKKKKKKDPYKDVRGNDMSSLTELKDSYPTVVLTQRFYTDDGKILDEGHYKIVVVVPKEKDGKYFVHFYQGHSHMGKIQMYETNNDYNEPEINYAKVIENDGEAMFIYGNIDCNLECKLWLIN